MKYIDERKDEEEKAILEAFIFDNEILVFVFGLFFLHYMHIDFSFFLTSKRNDGKQRIV